MISVSLVVADVPASPPPRSLISPRKPHQQTSSYFWNETLRLDPASTLPRYLSEGSINPLDGQLASNVIDTCGHATSNGRVGNPFFCADILDFPVISIESDVDGLSLFRRQFSQGLADFFQNRFFRLILFCLNEQV